MSTCVKLWANHIHSMSTGARQASNTLHTVHALLLSGALYPSIPLPSLSGVFVFVCDCVGACEFLCDVKSCSVYLLSLCLMRCKQKAVSMQPLPALHQGCKHLAASLCFLQKQKKKTAREETLYLPDISWCLPVERVREKTACLVVKRVCVYGEVDVYDR